MKGLIFGGAYIRRGLSSEGNLRVKIVWASLIVGSKFTIFALFYFVFEGDFPSTSPRGAYILRGNLTEGVLRYRIGGPIFGGAYFRNFTVFMQSNISFHNPKNSVKDLLKKGFCNISR